MRNLFENIKQKYRNLDPINKRKFNIAVFIVITTLAITLEISTKLYVNDKSNKQDTTMNEAEFPKREEDPGRVLTEEEVWELMTAPTKEELNNFNEYNIISLSFDPANKKITAQNSTDNNIMTLTVFMSGGKDTIEVLTLTEGLKKDKVYDFTTDTDSNSIEGYEYTTYDKQGNQLFIRINLNEKSAKIENLSDTSGI